MLAIALRALLRRTVAVASFTTSTAMESHRRYFLLYLHLFYSGTKFSGKPNHMKENSNSLLTKEDRKYLKLLKQRIANELNKLLHDMKAVEVPEKDPDIASPASAKISTAATTSVKVQQDLFE